MGQIIAERDHANGEDGYDTICQMSAIAFGSGRGDYRTNAAFIVHAVNAHDELVAALEQVREEFKPKECNCDGEYIDGNMVGYPCYFHRIEDTVKSALARVREGGGDR